MGFYALQQRESLLTFDRGVSDFAYLLGISNIGLAFMMAYCTMNAKEIQRSTVAQLSAQMLFVATASMALFYMRGTLQLKDANGYPVDIARYLEWIRSCPSLAVLIGYATNGRSVLVQRSELSAFISILMGFAGTVLREPLAEICLILSICAHYTALYDFYDMFEEAITGASNSAFDADSLTLARTATLTSWNGFAITFFLARFGWISFEAGEGAFIAFELLAKSVFTVALLSANITIKDHESGVEIDAASGQHIKVA